MSESILASQNLELQNLQSKTTTASKETSIEIKTKTPQKPNKSFCCKPFSERNSLYSKWTKVFGN